MNFKPSYLNLYSSGELYSRLILLKNKLDNCNVCPHQCKINRNLTDSGLCKSGILPIMASYNDHHGEEPPLSGTNGSGTIFFGNCNLNCVFCQNADISQNFKNHKNNEISEEQLADIMLSLQTIKKCHNINFVSPTHFVPQIVESIYIAIEKGLRIPLVYNSNGYDAIDTIKLLDGIFDIYLPDLKYSNNALAYKYSDAKEYVENSREVIKEMYKQVGLLQLDENGIAQKGLIIRHLVLPNDISGTLDNLEWIASELSSKVTISLMAQYHPANQAYKYPLLSRSINHNEFEIAVNKLKQMGFSTDLCQVIYL